MAIARDASTNVTKSLNGVGSLTFSHTCSGSNRYLVVFVGDVAGDTVTGVTYNAVAMTQLVKISRNPNSGSLELYAYGLANPSTGANNVVVSRSGSTNWISAASISYTGASQTTSPVDAVGSSNGSGSSAASITTPIVTVADLTAVTGWALLDNGSTVAGTNWTEVGDNSADDGFIICESTVFPKTPTGSTSYTVNGGANSDIGQVIVSIAPVGVVASSHFINLLGVGN